MKNRLLILRFSRGFFLTLAFLIHTLVGCSSDRVPVHPTKGRILVDGQPAYGAIVAFHPVGDVGLKGHKPFARANKEGHFEVNTYDTGDGVPSGEYKVTVIWPENPEARGPSPDRLKGRYAKPEDTTIQVEIQKSETTLPTIKIDTKKTR